MQSIIPGETTTPLRSRADVVPVMPDTDFTLGQDVMYMDGKGLQARMVYKGAMPEASAIPFVGMTAQRL